MNQELALLETQQNIHDRIARQAPLDETLEAITRWIESMLPNALVSIMRFDPGRNNLSLVPRGVFSERYTRAMQAIAVGPAVGTCGAAAFHRKLVVSENVQSDPNFKPFRQIMAAEGLGACWSLPILSGNGELLGTFAVYYRIPASPSTESRWRLQRAAGLVALAIIRDRESRVHRALSERYRALYVHHPDGVYEFDLEGRFQRCNDALVRITGYPEQTLIGKHFNEFVHPEYRELTREAFDAARAGAVPHYEAQGVHPSGVPYYLEVTNFPVMVEGDIVGVYGICRDITERRRREGELRLLKRGIEASPNGIVMADARYDDLPLVYANDAFCRITGFSEHEVLGRNCRFLQGEDAGQDALRQVRHAIASQEDTVVTLRNYRKDGSPFWNRLTISPVFDQAGECSHFIGIQEDITRQREQEAQLAYQASHDSLTGLPNRGALNDRLEEAFCLSRRNRGLLVVMYLDLDGFRQINDGLGHHVGNQLLVEVAERLQQLIRPGDTLARLVGDEFVMVLPGFAEKAEAVNFAERVLDTLSSPFEIDGRPVHISVSIGIACTCEPLAHAREMLQNADLAMAAAKQQGRNTWHWYRGDAQASTSDAVLLRHDLHAAIRDDQFELYYQPVVEAANGRMCGVEALIRWHHPERGVVSPGEFIPLAEQTGQIVAMGRWVLFRACQDVSALNAEGERALPVSVHISPVQFQRAGFLDDVKQALRESGLPAHLLELEVTENVLMSGDGKAIEAMAALRALGVEVSIDDFGTGFSSLGYLRDLPIQKVKLDISFVRQLLTDRSSAAIIQGVITMAHHMGLVVVAEGVETPQQREELVRRNCGLLQGFLFSRPLPMDQLRGLPELLPG